MYNGIGLATPRGSGTSGYVQRNLAYIKPSFKGKADFTKELKRLRVNILLIELTLLAKCDSSPKKGKPRDFTPQIEKGDISLSPYIKRSLRGKGIRADINR